MPLRFRNDQAQLRDGWKCTLFFLAAMACFVLVGLVGRSLPPGIKAYAPSAVLVALLGLLLTLVAVRLEGLGLAGVGLRLDARFGRQFALGLLGGCALVAISTGLVVALAGVRLLPAEPPVAGLLVKLVVTLFAGALFEELLFRGYAFQRAVRGLGPRGAIAVFAVIFTLAHLPSGEGLERPVLLIAALGLVLDAVIQSLLFLRTGSLALPIGLHFAWNGAQQALGFGVSGSASAPAWFQPELGQAPAWLTGGTYGLEASALGLPVQVALLAWLWRSAERPPKQKGLAKSQALVAE